MMTDAGIAQIPNGGNHLRFAYEENYDAQFADVVLEYCVFESLGLKSAQFTGVRIKNSRFWRCYLRNAVFQNGDLTGSRFVECNLRHATFDGSRLWYVQFDNCDLNYANLLENLPPEQNLRRHLLQSLRVNALQRGEEVIARRLLNLELKAEREDKRAILMHANAYYRQHFNVRDRIAAFWSYSGHQLSRFVWGYGLSVLALLRTAALIVLLFAGLTYAFAPTFRVTGSAAPRALGVLEALYASALTFTSLSFGEFAPLHAGGRILVVLESLAGAVFIGLLAATAYRLIRR